MIIYLLIYHPEINNLFEMARVIGTKLNECHENKIQA